MMTARAKEGPACEEELLMVAECRCAFLKEHERDFCKIAKNWSDWEMQELSSLEEGRKFNFGLLGLQNISKAIVVRNDSNGPSGINDSFSILPSMQGSA